MVLSCPENEASGWSSLSGCRDCSSLKLGLKVQTRPSKLASCCKRPRPSFKTHEWSQAAMAKAKLRSSLTIKLRSSRPPWPLELEAWLEGRVSPQSSKLVYGRARFDESHRRSK
ncbi:hypothetical protein NL676_037274 [Syzygium grande]|nr:hypothetical protein NL676_037274 [Syzygium grande]